MNDDFFKTELKTNSDGNISMVGTYDIAGELVDRLVEQKETLWKRFCQDVCEKMVAYYAEDSIDVIHFHKAFNEIFNEVVKEWKDESKSMVE